MVSVVILGVMGAFGDASGTAHAQGDGIAVEIHHPTLIRYKTLGRLDISVTVGEDPVDDVWVAIGTDYLDAFSRVSFVPAPSGATGGFVLIPLGDVDAHEDRQVSGEVQAERYWRHGGRVEIRAGGATITSVDVSTFVFP